MYSRNYYSERQDRLNLPENYDGTAFIETHADEGTPDRVIEASYIDEGYQMEEKNLPSRDKTSLVSSLFSGNGLLGNLGLSIPNLGAEEILIIATAAFLFFSKNGDRECALVLLLLLFIN